MDRHTSRCTISCVGVAEAMVKIFKISPWYLPTTILLIMEFVCVLKHIASSFNNLPLIFNATKDSRPTKAELCSAQPPLPCLSFVQLDKTGKVIFCCGKCEKLQIKLRNCSVKLVNFSHSFCLTCKKKDTNNMDINCLLE